MVDKMIKRARAFIKGKWPLGQRKWSALLKGTKVKSQKVQGSDDRFFRRNISPFGGNRSLSNYGMGRKKGPSSGPVLLEKTQSKEDAEEVFTISQERPDQYMTMGATLTTNYKKLLADILRENIKGRASIFNGIFVQMFTSTSKRIQPNKNSGGREEKTGFHTKEGVYCFTHMAKELKNSAATLQRMMEKVLAD
nr:hypothetical protein [Tanacetum cinerariifolium]